MDAMDRLAETREQLKNAMDLECGYWQMRPATLAAALVWNLPANSFRD